VPVETADETTAPPKSLNRRVARNTAIFSIATGMSRIAGLVREIVASSFFGTSGPFSAFTIAFQVPNLVRNLFADAALSAAFVPVFTDLLERGRRRDAYRLASSMFLVILAALSAITAVFILAAPLIMPLFTGDKFTSELNQLTVGLSRVLFPIVVLLGLNGLVVGILNAADHFTIPAIAPLVWNVVIIVLLVALRPLFHGQNQMYAYAIGVLIGTAVQFLIALPVLRRVGFRFEFAFDWHDPRIWRVLRLMLPVTLGLGLINFDQAINSFFGSLVSEDAPRAIDAAFRIYMLPQGMFSVALSTVLFPAMSRYAAHRDIVGMRHTMANGVRQIFLLLIPSAAFMFALATPITRLVYQRGHFDAHSTELVASALFWFSLSLPFAGANLMLTRTFFALQQPWQPTLLAGGSLLLNALVSVILYKPLGIAGLVIGTGVSNAAMMFAQLWQLRPRLGGRVEGREILRTTVQIVVAAAVLAGTAYFVWWGADDALGQSLPAQIVAIGLALFTGTCFYMAIVLHLRIEEAGQIYRFVGARFASKRG
jgi:putative peptidoglycan lipid II flippase